MFRDAQMADILLSEGEYLVKRGRRVGRQAPTAVNVTSMHPRNLRTDTTWSGGWNG